MPNNNSFVQIGIAEWSAVFGHRIDALCLRAWRMSAEACLAQIIVRENTTVPRNTVFLGPAGKTPGVVIAYCNPVAGEACEHRVKETRGNLLAAVHVGMPLP